MSRVGGVVDTAPSVRQGGSLRDTLHVDLLVIGFGKVGKTVAAAAGRRRQRRSFPRR